jgi:hypothetical protein
MRDSNFGAKDILRTQLAKRRQRIPHVHDTLQRLDVLVALTRAEASPKSPGGRRGVGH